MITLFLFRNQQINTIDFIEITLLFIELIQFIKIPDLYKNLKNPN